MEQKINSMLFLSNFIKIKIEFFFVAKTRLLKTKACNIVRLNSI